MKIATLQLALAKLANMKSRKVGTRGWQMNKNKCCDMNFDKDCDKDCVNCIHRIECGLSTFWAEKEEKKMNENYLFKAKTWQGKWVQGFLFQVYDNETYAIGTSGLSPNDYGEIQGEHNTWFVVDPSTICRCTGLKDKNGTLIWENDICDRKERVPEIVNYNNGDWQLEYSYAYGKEKGYACCNLGFYVTEQKCVEVIGNIFDNPELLEVE